MLFITFSYIHRIFLPPTWPPYIPTAKAGGFTAASITVYNIDTLCIMKTNTYSGRDKIRDLYDVSFICNNYFDELSEPTKSLLRTAIEYKGMEQFDYIVEEQHDELIDEGKLAEDFLRMYEKLDLMYNNEEKQIAQDIKENALMTHAAESEIEQDRGLNLEEDWER